MPIPRVAPKRSSRNLLVLGSVVAGLAGAPGAGSAACMRSELIFFDGFESGGQGVWATQNLIGFARDYWTGDSLAGVTLATSNPVRAATSDAAGRYVLVDLAPAAAVQPQATIFAGYRATGNGPIALGGGSKSCDLFAMSAADVQRQYTLLGITPTSGLAILIADLRRPDDSPLTGTPLADISLQDAGATPIGQGPYFLGASGDVDNSLLVSTAFDGRARVAYLNVPITPATLAVVSAEPDVSASVTFSPIASGANDFVLGGAD
ncbi:MAG: hypothetical protein ABIV06_09185 [Thermoanaerobaculia bacterium]